MNSDQENLLRNIERNESPTSRNSSIANFIINKMKRHLLLLFVSFLIATCLTVYLYLNLIAINGNQSDHVNGNYKPLSRRKPMLDHESIFSDSGPSMLKLTDLLAHCIIALQVAGRQVVKLSLLNNEKLNNVGSKGKTLEGVDDVITNADLKSHEIILNTIRDTYRRLKIVSEEDTTSAFENTSFQDDILPMDRVEFANMMREQLDQIEGEQPTHNPLIDQNETLVWIDPLDATKEYSENLTSYVTLMGCIVHKSVPIAGIIHKPFLNLTYWSLKSKESYLHSMDLNHLLKAAAADRRNNLATATTDTISLIVSRSHAGEVEEVLKSVYQDKARVISAGGSGYKTIELIGGKADAYVHMTRIKKWDICAPHAILNSIPNGRMTDLEGAEIGFGNPKEKVVTSGLVASIRPKLHEDLVRSIRDFKKN